MRAPAPSRFFFPFFFPATKFNKNTYFKFNQNENLLLNQYGISWRNVLVGGPKEHEWLVFPSCRFSPFCRLRM